MSLTQKNVHSLGCFVIKKLQKTLFYLRSICFGIRGLGLEKSPDFA